MKQIPWVCLVVIGATGCSAAGGTRVSFGPDGYNHLDTTHSRDLITAKDLSRHPTLGTATLFDALRGLRPEFLAVGYDAGGSAISGARVIVDGSPRGGPEALRSIHVPYVREVRFVRGPDATIRFGAEYRWGAIIVTTDAR